VSIDPRKRSGRVRGGVWRRNWSGDACSGHLFDSFAQQTKPKYVIGASIAGSKSPCQFIGSVSAKSPAADAGIRTGDRIVAIDETIVTTVQDAAQRMRSESARPRDRKPYSVTVRRELYMAILERDGMKALESGLIAPLERLRLK
jgi:C-terminal processing protease CtpA/Prc